MRIVPPTLSFALAFLCNRLQIVPLHRDSLRPDQGSLYLLPYSSSSPLPIRNTCPSGCRRCISRTLHGMLVGGNVTSRPAATHSLCTASTSSTQTDIQAPLSAVWSPSGPNVATFVPRPRPPWPPWQRKI